MRTKVMRRSQTSGGTGILPAELEMNTGLMTNQWHQTGDGNDDVHHGYGGSYGGSSSSKGGGWQ